ncbi:archaeosortase/exosortase family protein [Haloferula sargassicola]|uniref:Exosortase/archaeosortase family protein n=1 Tax=Haloferula sargassicola TaxID=490096 RepID=A0ABP9UN22_9BACT
MNSIAATPERRWAHGTPARWLLAAIFPLIWLLDRSWWQLSPDVLVVAAILPLAWKLAAAHPATEGPRPRLVVPAAVLLALGIITSRMSVMAFAWAWLAVVFFLPKSAIPAGRLWLLVAGAFPWVLTDGNTLGWLFRLSGANLTARIFEATGYEVIAHGTELTIGGVPISVEAACGGMKLLQVLMSGGLALTALRFPRSRAFWIMVALLPALAWAANTLRIIVITAWGLAHGVASAAGAFHTWGAMVVIVAMLAGYLALAALVAKRFPLSRP